MAWQAMLSPTLITLGLVQPRQCQCQHNSDTCDKASQFEAVRSIIKLTSSMRAYVM